LATDQLVNREMISITALLTIRVKTALVNIERGNRDQKTLWAIGRAQEFLNSVVQEIEDIETLRIHTRHFKNEPNYLLAKGARDDLQASDGVETFSGQDAFREEMKMLRGLCSSIITNQVIIVQDFDKLQQFFEALYDYTQYQKGQHRATRQH